MTSEHRNVLIICVDEMRADHLGCMGNPIVQTPNLDRLAALGTCFRRGYCNNPICMPARTTMFTGLLPRDHGLRINGQQAHPGLAYLPRLLSDAGYRTHSAGKLHLTPWVPKAPASEAASYPECLEFWRNGVLKDFPTPYHGFQSVDFVGGHTSFIYGEYTAWLEARGGKLADLLPAPERKAPHGFAWRMDLPPELHYNRYVADSTIAFLDQQADAPFFAWCSFPDPHMPVAAPSPFYEMYDPASIPLPARREGEVDDLPPVYRDVLSGELRPNGVDNTGLTDGAWQEIIACTYAMITHLDSEVGRVIDALEANGQLDTTLIVFISDHGDMMGDHGLLWKSFYTFRGCIQIPYLAVVPGGIAGQQSDALVSQIDLLPSVLDWCRLPLPGADWQARQTPFQRGQVQELSLYPGRSWLPIANGDSESIHDCVVIENDDPTMGFRVRTLVTDRYRISVYPGMKDGELFDLQEDPDELRNLWSAPKHLALRQELIAQLLDSYVVQTPWYPIPPWNS